MATSGAPYLRVQAPPFSLNQNLITKIQKIRYKISRVGEMT